MAFSPPRVAVNRHGSISIEMGPAQPAAAPAAQASAAPVPPRAAGGTAVTAAPPSAAKAAARRKEELTSKALYDRLHKSFKKLSAKSQGYIAELRSLRDARAKADQQVRFLNRQVERLRHERTEAAVEAKAAREAKRKIEQKLAGGSGGQYLAEKYQALRVRARALKQKCEDQASVVSSQEASLLKAASQIDVLARALEVRVQELGLGQPGRGGGGGGGGGARSSLLYEVAQQRSEMQRLAGELAERTSQVNGLRGELALSRTATAAAVDAKTAVDAHAGNTARDLEAARSQAEQQAVEITRLGRDRDVMIDYIKEMQEQSSTNAVEAAAAADRAAREITALRARAQEAEGKVSVLQETVQVAEKRATQMGQIQELTEGRLASEHVEIASLRTELLESQRKLTVAQAELAQASSRLEAATAEGSVLEDRVRQADEKRNESEQKVGVAVARADLAERQVADANARLKRLEAEYQSNLEGVLKELERTVGEKEKINADMQTAVSTLATLREENTGLLSRLGSLQGADDAIRENKGLLQKTLLDQIAALRARVQTLEAQLAQANARRYGSAGGGRLGRTTTPPSELHARARRAHAHSEESERQAVSLQSPCFF